MVSHRRGEERKLFYATVPIGKHGFVLVVTAMAISQTTNSIAHYFSDEKDNDACFPAETSRMYIEISS